MSLWWSRLLGYFPCCPIAGTSRRQSRAGIQLKPKAVSSQVEPCGDGSVLYRLFADFIDDTAPELDSNQLHDLLNSQQHKELLQIKFPFDGFSFEICRAMVTTRDLDHSGRLGYDELKQLFEDIREWLEVFEKNDIHKLGYFRKETLEEILRSLGLGLSEETVRILSMRYCDKEERIHFGDFVAAALRLKLMADTWTERCDSEKALFSTDEFIQLSMYA